MILACWLDGDNRDGISSALVPPFIENTQRYVYTAQFQRVLLRYLASSVHYRRWIILAFVVEDDWISHRPHVWFHFVFPPSIMNARIVSVCVSSLYYH